MSATVSVIIPTYNGVRFVGEALRSVFAQTQPPKEVIVVDDASTDGTPEMVRYLAEEKTVPLGLLVLARNSGGPAHPLNLGIAAAAGDYIAILEQDDRFVSDNLLRKLSLIASGRCAGAGFVASDLVMFDETGPDAVTFFGRNPLFRQRLDKHCRDGVALFGPGEVFQSLCHEHCLDHKGLFPKRVWQELGGYDESLRCAADMDWICRLACRYEIAVLDEVLLESRRHGGNLSAQEEVAAPECVEVFRRMLAGPVGPEEKRVLERRIHKELYDLAHRRRRARDWLGAAACYLRLARARLLGSC
jgi:glycosyltransferase involved in cell wall biosynthesis